jgi:hypothetical protein
MTRPADVLLSRGTEEASGTVAGTVARNPVDHRIRDPRLPKKTAISQEKRQLPEMACNSRFGG